MTQGETPSLGRIRLALHIVPGPRAGDKAEIVAGIIRGRHGIGQAQCWWSRPPAVRKPSISMRSFVPPPGTKVISAASVISVPNRSWA